jgi:hypothetical protein
VAALVQRNDVKAVCKGRSDTVKPVRMSGAAVQKTESRRARRSGLEHVQRDSVDFEGAVTCHVTAEL